MKSRPRPYGNGQKTHPHTHTLCTTVMRSFFVNLLFLNLNFFLSEHTLIREREEMKANCAHISATSDSVCVCVCVCVCGGSLAGSQTLLWSPVSVRRTERQRGEEEMKGGRGREEEMRRRAGYKLPLSLRFHCSLLCLQFLPHVSFFIL